MRAILTLVLGVFVFSNSSLASEPCRSQFEEAAKAVLSEKASEALDAILVESYEGGENRAGPFARIELSGWRAGSRGSVIYRIYLVSGEIQKGEDACHSIEVNESDE